MCYCYSFLLTDEIQVVKLPAVDNQLRHLHISRFVSCSISYRQLRLRTLLSGPS